MAVNTSTIDVMDRGIDCLVASLGVVDTERFISFVIREKFDYTKWQREHFDDDEDLAEHAALYAKANPIEFKRIRKK